MKARKKRNFTLALFYCQNTPGSGERERQTLEREYGKALRLFPLPCGGRMEPLHLLRALEEMADAAYLVACPAGACRYFEGNARAAKRVERTREILSGIGLEPERAGIVIRPPHDTQALAGLVDEVMSRLIHLGPSPALGSGSKGLRKKHNGR